MAAFHNATRMMLNARAPSDKFRHLVRLNCRSPAYRRDICANGSLVTRPLLCLNIQYLPPSGITLCGGAASWNPRWPHCYTQGVPHARQRTPALATTGIWWPPPRWGTWRNWTCAIRRTRDLVPPHGHNTETRWLSSPHRGPFATEQILETPFHLARRIPKDTWKTVTDALNGYHSIPLHQSERHLTTFITPFGRWRYTRAPQGFLSSGNGYNRRFDAVLSTFERKERCVDDTIYYDSDLEQHWWRTIDLLTRVGQAGIVLNPDKFQFVEKSVNFAGFRVSDTTMEPLSKYLDAIRDFPSPASTTDIRSWFGLVN